MSKSIEEITADIVVAVINSAVEKPDERVKNGTVKLTTADIPKLIKDIHEVFTSLELSDSE